MPIAHLSSWDDERFAPYRNLKDQALRAQAGRFIAEGTQTLRMLLQSQVSIESLLLKPSLATRLAPELAARPELPVWTVETSVMSAVVGYEIHRGALACGHRPPGLGTDWLRQRLAQPGPLRLLVLDAVHDPWNVGGIIRSARGLGLDAVVCGPGCADPWYRRAIRVSMGHVFHLPLVTSEDLPATLALCQAAGLVALAGRLGVDSRPVASCRPGRRWALVIGNEDRAVSPPVAALCSGIHIPMAPGVDSLNAGVSAAVLAHALLLREEASDAD